MHFCLEISLPLSPLVYFSLLLLHRLLMFICVFIQVYSYGYPPFHLHSEQYRWKRPKQRWTKLFYLLLASLMQSYSSYMTLCFHSFPLYLFLLITIWSIWMIQWCAEFKWTAFHSFTDPVRESLKFTPPPSPPTAPSTPIYHYSFVYSVFLSS